MRAIARPLLPATVPSVPTERPFAVMSVPLDRQRSVRFDEQNAPSRSAAMLHPGDYLLAHIAAFPETDAAQLFEKHVMRKSLAERIVRTALRNAIGDAQVVPFAFLARRARLQTIDPLDG